MFDHCLFCHAALESNQTLERFPIGRRLAFDARKGQLWVVCSSCRQWNLVPVELRWEVIEDCQREYRDSAQVVSTENIGLAQVSDDLEVVAVGEPTRLEFAAWRYGSRLTARWEARRRVMRLGVLSGGAVGLVTALAVAPVVGIASAATAGVMGGLLTREALVAIRGRKHIAAVPVESDYWIRVAGRDLPNVRVEPSYALRSWFLRVIGDGDRYREAELYEVSPELGVPTLALVMPTINRLGGRSEQIERAIQLVEENPDPKRLVYAATKGLGHGRPHHLQKMPAVARLALEVSTQEDMERLAAEGELKVLERAWKEAASLAEISDSMLEPSFVSVRLRRLKRAL